MSKNVIFCYSGSGNCLDIAKNIAKRLGDTDIVMMRAEPEVKDVRGAKRVGFVFRATQAACPAMWRSLSRAARRPRELHFRRRVLCRLPRRGHGEDP